MKQHKAMIVALIVICITAVVAALVTRKTSVRFTSELARRRLLFSRLTNPSKSNGGGDPRHFTGARISSTHPGFYPGLPTGRLLGRLASQVVKKLLHAIKEAL